MAAVNVRGLRELDRAFEAAGKQVQREFRQAEKEIAEPTKQAAERLATERIPSVTLPWSRMRVGVTRTMVYVAPVKRGVKGRGTGGRRRPRFGTLLMDRAMEPALTANTGQIVSDYEQLLDKVGDKFNRG